MGMTNEEWSGFLDNVAIEVDKLLLQPGALDTFRLKIHPFKERWDKHCDESRRHAEVKLRHWEAVKGNAKLRIKAAGPPKKGWEWDHHYVADVGFQIGAEYEIPPEYVQDVIAAVEREIERTKRAMEKCPEGSSEYRGLADYLPVVEEDLADLRTGVESLTPDEKTMTWIKAPQRHRRHGPSKDISGFMWFRVIGIDEREIFGCWRPPLKEIQEHPCNRLIPEQGTRKLPPPRDRTEEYERYYVSLASIHDNRLPHSESITEGVWRDDLAQAVWARFSGGYVVGPDRAFIATALNRVKAELDTADAKADGQRRAGKKIDHGAEINAIRDIEQAIRLVEALNCEKERYARRREKLLRMDIPPVQTGERLESDWRDNVLPLITEIEESLKSLHGVIRAHWSGRWRWKTFLEMLAEGKDNYAKWKASGWADIHIQELQAVERALGSPVKKPNGPGQRREPPTTATPSEHMMSTPDESDRQRMITVLRHLSTQMNSWATIGWSGYTVSPISDLLCSLTGYDVALLHLRRHFPSFFEVQELHRRYQAVRDHLEEHKKELDVKTEPEWSMAFRFRTLVGELGHYGMELAQTLRQIAKAKEDATGPEQAGENARPAARGGSASEAKLVSDGVFISYSHKDKKWFRELQDHLKPYTRNESVTFWSDEAISPGREWFAQIKAALASTKVAVLLVTKDFLASEFIAEHEFKPLLEQARTGNVQIIWIPLGACSYKETELKSLQALIDPDKPLAKMKKQDRDKAWVKICEAVKEAITR